MELSNLVTEDWYRTKKGCRAKDPDGVGAVVSAALTSGGPHTVAGDSLSSEQASLACFAGLACSTANDH